MAEGLLSVSRLSKQDVVDQLCDPTVANVFDFDGTLFKTGAVHGQSSRMTFQELGVSGNITPEFIASVRGKSDEEIYALVFGAEQRELIEQAVMTRSRKLVELAEGLEDPASLLLAGVSGAVRILRRTGQTAGIASASPDAFVNTFLRRAAVDGEPMEDVFPAHRVVGATRIKDAAARGYAWASPKPAPYSIMCASRSMDGSRPDAILYIGDSHVDVESIVAFPAPISGLIVGDSFRQVGAEVNDPNIVFAESLADVVAQGLGSSIGASALARSAELTGSNL